MSNSEKVYPREFEYKYLVDANYTQVWKFLGEYLGYEITEGYSSDTYWTPTTTSKYESVRIRQDSRQGLRLTTKGVDRKSTADRSELEMVLIPNDLKYATRLISALLGTKPLGILEKEYILNHPKPGSRNCISVELVRSTGDVIVEVEGVDQKSLDKHNQILQAGLEKLGVYYERAHWSCYEKYILGTTKKTKLGVNYR